MNISDQELQSLVRDAIARHAVHAIAPPVASSSFDGRHASHVRFLIAVGSEGDGACLIEPAVRCNHCGYCQSYGH